MKKITFTLMIAITTIISYAQTQSSDHLLFKGVPIDGTLNQYVSKMKQNGFSLIETKDGLALLKGDFAAYKDCIVGVVTLKQKDLVSKIAVIFPEHDTWSMLSGNYFKLKEMLTQKYGEPSDCIEKFDTDYEPDDDNDRMYNVKFDKCKYYTEYETDKGSIILSIEHEGVTSCYVLLSYYDKINGEIIKANAIDDL